MSDHMTATLSGAGDVTDAPRRDLDAPAPPAPPASPSASEDETTLRARTRWAGIVWGVVLATLAIGGVWLASGEARIDDLVVWVSGLSPTTAIGLGVLAVGALILVTGLVGLLRRAQRAVAGRK